MTDTDLASTIDAAWEARDTISPATKGAVREAVEAALAGLDSGTFASPPRSTARGASSSG